MADPGPYGNLFKGSGKPQTQSFDVSGGLFGGYDDNLLAQGLGNGTTNPFDPRFQVPGVTTGLNSSAQYGYVHAFRGRSASQFRFGGGASVQEFTGADRQALWVPNYGAATSFGTNLTPKILFSASLQASYAPFYQYVPFMTNGGASSSAAVSTVVAPVDGAPSGNEPTPEIPIAAINNPNDRTTSQASTRPIDSRVSMTNGLQNGTYEANRMKPAVPPDSARTAWKYPTIAIRLSGRAMIWRSSGRLTSEPAAA